MMPPLATVAERDVFVLHLPCAMMPLESLAILARQLQRGTHTHETRLGCQRESWPRLTRL
jgi:hypothetical protein